MSFTILGTGSCLPELVVTNDDLSRLMDTSDEWIATRTGIRSRRIVTRESLTDMASQAGRSALEDAGLAPKEIDLIVCTTIQGDYVTPSMANLIQRDIGASCPAFDLNAACSGFLYALDTAQAYLDANKARHVLVVSAEQMSKHVDWSDRTTCVLFGDGAAAAVLGKGESLKYLRVTSSGSTEHLQIAAPRRATSFGGGADQGQEESAGTLFMNGQGVYKFAVSACTEGIRQALEDLALSANEIGHYLLHQANYRIIDSIRRALGQPEEKFPVILEHTGNSSSVSIPCLLDELNRTGRLQKGERILLSAFGAGWTTGNCVLVWDR